MTLKNPSLAEALQPLYDALPLVAAMPDLVVRSAPPVDKVRLVEAVLQSPAIAGAPRLAAGLWLYVDDLDRSHRISQSLEDSTGAFWHGIMHRREGDFSNSHYWFRRVGQHPAMDEIPDYNPRRFIDDVEQRHSENPPDLVELQRREWQALFTWCLLQHA
jgi:hypothetical protein